ncbi:hypothetical protein CHUAL_009050 [Chamberlinius hualienensis]
MNWEPQLWGTGKQDKMTRGDGAGDSQGGMGKAIDQGTTGEGSDGWLQHRWISGSPCIFVYSCGRTNCETLTIEGTEACSPATRSGAMSSRKLHLMARDK